jgi:hypothetical protein
MRDCRIAVTVGSDGRVHALRRDNNATSPEEPVGYRGLDAELVRLFERWLTLRDRQWRDDEIRAFGSLLHRCLFPQSVWSWIEGVIRELRTRGTGVRLELIFPAEPPWSRLAAVPWEYLYRPEPESDTATGYFLAAEAGLVLSRYIPSAQGEADFPPEPKLRLLVAVSEPRDPRLGPVVHDDVIAEIERTAAALGFEVAVLHDPTARQLSDAVHGTGSPPHLVHFMGHGEFDAVAGQAQLALIDPDGGTDWVDDRRLSDIMTRGRQAPRAVVLHSCEGGRADFSASFAGLAPQLVRRGVQCVVAMQYPVTNDTAIDFSTTLYRLLADGMDLDAAVQEARWSMTRLQVAPDPRLLGIPVIYLQSRSALLGGGHAGEASGP